MAGQTPETPVTGIPEGVLLQFSPDDDRCETFTGRILAKTGDPAPGGGGFAEFFKNSENERGDVAFLATLSAVPSPAPIVEGSGVFLYEARSRELEKIVREGDPLPGTDGGRYCSGQFLNRGPWLNDDGVVMFIADCVEDSAGAPMPDQEGSAFLWTEKGGLRLFFRNHSEIRVKDGCDVCGLDEDGTSRTVHRIEVGDPGLSENRAVFAFVSQKGLGEFSMVGTKKLSEDADDRRVEICAEDDEQLPNGESILLGANPSISSDDILSFGVAESGWADNAPSERFGAFTCYQRQLHRIVDQGDPMPVGQHNRFGPLTDESNSDRQIVFLNRFDRPNGVFTANSNPQLP